MTKMGKFSNERYEEIKQEVLLMYEDAGIDTVPIDCFRIAKNLKYLVKAYSDLRIFDKLMARNRSKDGYSRVEMAPSTGMNYYAIYYNDEDTCIGRIRWTIFHELGHIYLGHHDNPPGNESVEEDEANFFAKYAMCPPPLLNAVGCHCPEDVLLKFNTSGEFSGYAYNYFRNWQEYGPSQYLPYELEMLKQFHFDVA